MAVAYDAASTSKTSAAGATSLTWSHVCAGGSPLIVGVATDGVEPMSTITFNGDALSEIDSEVGGVFNASYLWGIANPDAATGNIVVTPLTSAIMVSGGISTTGGDTSTGWGTPATATGSSTTPTVDVGSATGELVIDVQSNGVGGGGAPTSAPGTNQTERYDDFVDDKMRGTGSHEDGGATITMSHTLSGSELWSICAVAVLAAAGGVASRVRAKRMSFTGVG